MLDPTVKLWSPSARAQAERSGYLLVPPSVVIATHLVELLRRYAPDLMTRQSTRDMVERLRGQHAVLLDEVVPKLVSLGTLQRVLQGLLAEQIPVRSLARIVEAVADGATAGQKDTTELVEIVRRQLGPALWQPYLGPDRKLPVLMLDPTVQDRFRQSEDVTKAFAVTAVGVRFDSRTRAVGAIRLAAPGGWAACDGQSIGNLPATCHLAGSTRPGS